MIIAIDGPVGSGKSTVARRVAAHARLFLPRQRRDVSRTGLEGAARGVLLDSPASLVVLAETTRIDLTQEGGALRVSVDGADVTEAIRSAEVARGASQVAVVPEVRTVLVDQQRRAGQAGGVVMEGRDIGTVVFPDAHLKIFLDASPEVRAERRRREYLAKGQAVESAAMLGAGARARPARPRARGLAPGARGGRRAGGQHGHGRRRDGAADCFVGEGKGRRSLGRRLDLQQAC